MASNATARDTCSVGRHQPLETATSKQHTSRSGFGMSSSNSNDMQESTQPGHICKSQAPPEVSSSLNRRPTATEYPITRIPYWEDTRIMVVTKTEAVGNLQGGWIVNKKKYLEYPKGWTGPRYDAAGGDDSRTK
jgi:hypothetical protein